LFSKNDSRDPRLGEFALPLEKATPESLRERARPLADGRAFALCGYADDEGIRCGGGRLGARLAPPAVRQHLYKMTPSLLSQGAGPEPRQPAIIDVGDLTPGAEALGDRHEAARALAAAAMRAGLGWLAIGGGHDYGYADAAAFADVCAERGARPLVINFDAHLDVRPYCRDDGTPSYGSGTPFSRFLDLFPESDLAEIGLQGQCNARAHLDWLTSRGGRALFYEEVELSGRSLLAAAAGLLGDWFERRRPAFISVDIDAFSLAFAPGCSQSFAAGLSPDGFFPLLQALLKRLDVWALAIYEVSPPLDEGSRSSRLAAQILHRAIFPL
jgi:formiminoglutamase